MYKYILGYGVLGSSSHSVAGRRRGPVAWGAVAAGRPLQLEERLQHPQPQLQRAAEQALYLCWMILPPFQIISHFKNLGESKFFKFDQIYMTR